LVDAIIRRAAWGARPPKDIFPTGPARVVWAHNTAGAVMSPQASQADEAARLRAIQNFHMGPDNPATEAVEGRDWSDIAYSFLIAPSGRRYEGRGWGRKHGGNLGSNNSNTVSLCLIGNYDNQDPTPRQIEAFRQTIADGLEGGHIVRGYALLGHRDEPAAKSCPGDKVYPRLKEFVHRRKGVVAPEEEDMGLTEEESAMLEEIRKDTASVATYIRNLKAAGVGAGVLARLLKAAAEAGEAGAATVTINLTKEDFEEEVPTPEG
jgi:hypothetical protein